MVYIVLLGAARSIGGALSAKWSPVSNHRAQGKLTHLKLFCMALGFAEQGALDLCNLGVEGLRVPMVENKLGDGDRTALALRLHKVRLRNTNAAEDIYHSHPASGWRAHSRGMLRFQVMLAGHPSWLAT